VPNAAGLSKADFITQLDRGAATLGEALPVSSALLRYMAAALRQGDPAWWQRTQKAWESRAFVNWAEAWTLFLTAVHADALGDEESPLAPYFPSCGGTPEADPSTVFARYLNDLPREFFDQLKSGHRRTFVPTRAPLWMPPVLPFFQNRALPYYLVEVNSGGGLNLAADLFSESKFLAADLIAARIGLEPSPLNLEDIGHRRWLTAGILPENTADIAKLDQVVDVVAKRMRTEAAFIQLAQCETAMAPAFIAKNIPSDDTDVGLFVFNMATTGRMTDAEYAAYANDMAQMLAPWGERGLWLEVETVRGELYSTTFQGVLHRPDGGGRLKSFVMVRYDFVTRRIQFDEKASDAFLTVAPPPKPAPR
jgi:hypothetical protein